MKKVTFIMLFFTFLSALPAHGQSSVYTDACAPGYEWDGWESDAVPCFQFFSSGPGSFLGAVITVEGDDYSASVQSTPGSCLTWPDELATGSYSWTYTVFYLNFITPITVNGSGPSFSVDIDAPNTPVVSVTEGTGSSSINPPWTDVNNPTFTWTDPGDVGSGVSYYEVSINGESWQEVSSGWQPDLSDGIYTFDFRSVDGAGNTSAPQRIHMRIDATAPTAVAGSDAQITEWETYNFDGSSSSDNIDIAGFTWSFQDSGSDQYLYGASPSYTFNNPGVFEVLLTVSDSSGTTDTDTLNITVNKTIYTISGSSGMNGTISPDGDPLVQREENFAYSLIPDSSYYVLDVLLDGVSVVSDISFSEGIGYDTLWSVSDNHTIDASFEPIVETWPEVSPLDYGDSIGSAELSGGVANVEGSFALDQQDSIPDAGNIDVVLIFTPANTDRCVAQYNTANILVNQVDLTISGIPDTIRYDATAYEGGNGLIFDGFVNGEDSTVLVGTSEFGGSSQGAVDTGTYLIVPSGYTSENYDISYLEAELIILQAELQVAAIDNDKIFGESDPVFAYEITEGSLLGDDVLTGTLSREEGEAVGAYQILPGDLNAGSNYNLVFEAGTFTILGRLSLSSSEGGEVTQPGEGIFTYTEPMEVQLSAQALENYYFSHWSGDVDNLSTTDNEEISILVDGNYTILATFELIVETWPEVSPLDYGDSIGSSELSGGLANVEGSFALDQQDSIPDAGNIDVVLVFTPSNTDRCVVQYYTTNILVNQVDITISAIPDTIKYNATAYEGGNGLIFDGFVNGEDSTVLVGTSEFGGSSQGAVDTGKYLIVPSGYTSENYDISYLEAELIILQAELQVAAIDNDKIFGESDPVFAYEITEGSLLGDDVLTGTLSREEGEAVGAYQILPGDLNAGSNYNLVFEAGTFTILGQLSLSSSEGGEVTQPGEGIFTYTEPMEVQISAQALESYNFSHWSGDVDNLSITDNEEISILVDGNYSIVANFVLSSTALNDLWVDKFTVYPNPTQDYVYIDLSPCEFNTPDLNFQFFDMQGRLLKEGKIVQDRTKVSLKSYYSGQFLLKIFNENIPLGSTVILKK